MILLEPDELHFLKENHKNKRVIWNWINSKYAMPQLISKTSQEIRKPS